MSSIFPIMFREMIRPMRMMEHQMRIMQEELMRPQYIPTVFRGSFFNDFPCKLKMPEADDSSVTCDKDKFQLKMDVQHFRPNEIKVKMGDNNTIIVEAKHEEKPDENGFITRQIVRRFLIPEGHDLKQIASCLSSDGVLTITAPKNPETVEREIPIMQTGPEKTIENKKSEEPETLK